MAGDWLIANGNGGVRSKAQACAAEIVLLVLAVAPRAVGKGCTLWVDPPEFYLFSS